MTEKATGNEGHPMTNLDTTKAKSQKPTHWMDDRGLVVSDKWLKSDAATSDYRAVYNIPCVVRRGKFVPIKPETDDE
jgi:hypothetical protein